MYIKENNITDKYNAEKIAHDMVKKTYPPSLQSEYETHLGCQYDAISSYVYILQDLTEVLFSIGLGVISNIVYSKINKRKELKDTDIRAIIDEYEKKLNELKLCLYRYEYKNCKIEPIPTYSQDVFHFDELGSVTDEVVLECQHHEKMLLALKEQDPEIVFAVQDALVQLNNRGKS